MSDEIRANPATATVVALGGGKSRPFTGLVVGGRRIVIGQEHLLKPFAELAAAVESLASAVPEGTARATEESLVREAYCAIYEFFRALLPSASHEVIDGLTYSVALLLVGEAVEAGRVVAGPVSSQ